MKTRKVLIYNDLGAIWQILNTKFDIHNFAEFKEFVVDKYGDETADGTYCAGISAYDNCDYDIHYTIDNGVINFVTCQVTRW